MTLLSFTHLHLAARATTDVILDGHHAGNNLRNALANVMLHDTCPETHRRAKPTPEHAAVCPACWLLASETDPGSVVRAYSVIPPRPPRERVFAGQPFSFGLTLFGDGFQFLPYIVLAAAEIGRVGVGPGRRDGQGRFELVAIDSFNPPAGAQERLLTSGDPLVRQPTLRVDLTSVLPVVDQLSEQLEYNGGNLTLRFLTPLRLEEGDRLFKSPDFGVFFRRLLYRVDDLSRQFAGTERRDRDEVEALNSAADRVRLVESRTRWHELWSYSGRKGRDTPLSGLVGSATYYAADWEPLLPWLLLGQGTQVGKSAVKGNGVYEVSGITTGYWEWLRNN